MQLGRKVITKRFSVLAAVLLSILGMVARSGAQGLESTLLPPPDPSTLGFFGATVSLSADGQTALVGSPWLQKAFVFVRGSSGWVLEAGLSPDPAFFYFYGSFGSVVALSGDGRVALVADLDEPCSTISTYPCGAVSLYERTGGGIWVLREHLAPPYWLDFEFLFGSALALSADGSTVLIGRPADDCVHQPCRGVVFVYERSGDSWNLVEKLKASNPSVRNLGAAISLSPDGSTALIGAPWGTCTTGSSCGEAYVFTRGGGGWSEQERVIPSDGAPGVRFGASIGLSADGLTALVGAPADGIDPQAAGSVYSFVRSGSSWIGTQKITGEPGEEFGRPLALAADGRSALIGALSKDCAAGTDCGAVYQVTRRAGGLWSPLRSLASFPAGAQGGSAVALSWNGSIGLAGAPQTSCAAGSYCGAVHVFSGLLAPAIIPTLGGAGLAALTLALILSALVLLRRRRAL